MVHGIGFGLGNAADEDTWSLQANANASGGRYVTASSAEELKEALVQTVATSFSVYKGNVEVASGSLGSDETMFLPKGDYRVELHSSPPQIVPISLTPRDSIALTLEKVGGKVYHVADRQTIEHRACDDVVARIERLENRRASTDTN